MCGINGILNFSNKTEADEAVQRMNVALKHRGPDFHSHFSDDFAALGHARLSIIDLSSSANQPFHSSCGKFTIVFNGEIYNYQEVKKYLTEKFNGIQFRTSSDTEVLLEGYIRLGQNIVHHLNGMFAFAIYDKEKKSLFAARDRTGEKPFYYAMKGNTLVFSSEMRAVLASKMIPPKLNASALYEYIQFQFIGAPNTMLEHVLQLAPGHQLLYSNNVVETSAYWKPEIKPQVYSRNEAVQQVKSKFEEAIRLRMVADVEVGAFLSGGIDSSAIVAQMAQLSNKSLSTFSVIFGEEDFSEEIYSNAIARKYNTNHHPIKISANDFLHDIPHIVNAMDAPGGDGPNTYVVAHATRKTGIKVALSGVGGDELFAGYPVFKQVYSFHKKKLLKNSPRILRKGLSSALATMKKGPATQKLKRILSEEKLNDAVFYAHSRQLFDKSFANALLKASFSGATRVEDIAVRSFQHAFGSTHLLSQVSLAEMQTYLVNVLLKDADQMTMAHALEVRAPFLDHELIELVLGINDDLKYPHSPKQLFVEAMGDLLPHDIVNRKKMGFVFPWAKWMKNELKSFCESSIRNLAARSYFNEKNVLELWNRFERNDHSVPWSRIWHLVVLEEWMKKNGVE